MEGIKLSKKEEETKCVNNTEHKKLSVQMFPILMPIFLFCFKLMPIFLHYQNYPL